MMPIYLKLFNLIFDSGVVPETWLVGDILPIYKKQEMLQYVTNAPEGPLCAIHPLNMLYLSVMFR